MSAFLRVSARANPLECQRYVVPCESRRAMVSCRRRDQSCYGGLMATNASRTSLSKRLRYEVLRRDNYTCQYCGRDFGLMNAHHVMIREFSATRCDPRNGITVCAMPCHTRVMHGQPDKAEAFYHRHLGAGLLAEIRQKGYEGVGAKYGAAHWQAELANLRALLAVVDVEERQHG